MPARLKVFNLEEANVLLPQLEALLSELEEREYSFERQHDELFFEELLEEISPPESRLQALEASLTTLEEPVQKIRELGCVLRHPRRGFVDFLARQGNEWVFFCWRRGEKQIEFYHSLHGGFFERQRLSR